ncbi:MAG: hypothetical protein M1837_003757 [Sclerophora amabilis]|nr:MAG: hypothetical protein M1837_003757 [Sclerophora amabilis]
MRDPFFAPPAFVIKLAQPIANTFNLPTLPFHAHEIVFAFTLYHLVNTKVSPYISARLFPNIYPHFPLRTKINWDVHVVSLVQSVLINALALWVLRVDGERQEMDWRERVWGYTGAGGMIQGFAAGYFLWDLMITSVHVEVFGWGMLAHAISALVVFSLGFVSFLQDDFVSGLLNTGISCLRVQRPFVNYYGPTFILYELSSPFLNFHWFFDKVNMTGSKAQWYNGIALLASFLSCRLLWGTYQSVRVYQDVWAALQAPGPDPLSSMSSDQLLLITNPDLKIMKLSGPQVVPLWLSITYLGSNIVLNTLNFYWFGKMIETVRKRFEPPKEAKIKAASNENGKKQQAVKSSLEMDRTSDNVMSIAELDVRRRTAKG